MTAPRLLLALDAVDEAARTAVGRANALSVGLAAELHVVLVTRTEAPGPVGRELELFQSERELRRVCRAELPEALGSDRLRVRPGSFVTEVLAEVRARAPRLVVLAAVPSAWTHAADLAAEAAVQVLVARPARGSGAIVAATDLGRPGYPVVQLAASLRERLDAPVALVHNVEPADGEVQRHVGLAAQTQHLREVAADLIPGAELVTTERYTAASAIIEAGLQRDCDLIVVGVPSPSRGLDGTGVAAAVVRSAMSSVLVAPLG